MTIPMFSVVIPTFNRREALFACLDAIARQTSGSDSFEVIVVDDGSNDGTSDAVRSRGDRFALTCLTLENGGASRARNEGIRKARGTYIALTEDDAIPDDRWLEIAAGHLADGTIDVLEGATVYAGSKEAVRRFEPRGAFSFIPCNLFLRRGVFEKVGGYDPEFFDGQRHLYFREDTELGFRILDAGFHVATAADVLVSHPRQFGTLGECFRHAKRYYFDPLLYRKHPVRYRAMIESKKAFGIILHRPLHYVALGYGAMCAVTVAALVLGQWTVAGVGVLAAFAAAQMFRVRYRGRDAIRFDRIFETLAFCLLPAVYLAAIIRGSIRFRTAGALW